VASDLQTKFQLRDPREVAQTELARWRRRLGPLTHEQEVEIEDLVISTATKISLLGGRVLQSLLECTEKNAVINAKDHHTADILDAVPRTA
jgi:hypothetical protein